MTVVIPLREHAILPEISDSGDTPPGEHAILPEISDSGDTPPGTCYLTRNQ